MATQFDNGISRRRFLASTSLATAVGLLAPRALFAGTEVVSAPGLVEKARNEAASATITVERLRGNIMGRRLYEPKNVYRDRFRGGLIRFRIVRMDPEQSIAEIEWLQRIFAVPDTRPLSPSDLMAANRRHDDMLAHSPCFRLWQRYGVCCRVESPAVLRLPGTGN